MSRIRRKSTLTIHSSTGRLRGLVSLISKLKLPWFLFLIFAVIGVSYYSNKQRNMIRDYTELLAQVVLYPLRIFVDTDMWMGESEPEIKISLEQLSRHISDNQQLQILDKENQTLKSLLDFREHHHIKAATARVMGYSRAFGSHKLFVNAGSLDGITEGAAVIHPDGLVGQIVSVSEYASWVMTVHDPLSRIPAVLAISRQKALAVGDQTSSTYLPLRYTDFSELSEDEIALTSGEGGSLPYGLYIGKVVRQHAELAVVSSVPWSTLDYVLVLSVNAQQSIIK